MSVAPDSQPSLERVIGVRALAANTINLTVGAGIFVLPAVVAARLGPSAIFAYLVCAFAMGLVLLCFAEAGSRVHESGGACAYVEAAFGGARHGARMVEILTLIKDRMESLQAAVAQQCPEIKPGDLRLSEAVQACTLLQTDVAMAERQYENAKKRALAGGVWLN